MGLVTPVFFVIIRSFIVLGFDFFEEIRYCRFTEIGKEYSGQRQTSRSGRVCNPWKSVDLQAFRIRDLDFPEGNRSAVSNYCRNPNNSLTGPWCFVQTPAVSAENCEIPFCGRELDWCKDTFIGKEYAGHINVTESGLLCQNWSSQTPHRHGFLLKDFNERSWGDLKNYCRNPDNDIVGPWCYTTNKENRREQCSVPLCRTDMSQSEYFGQRDVFASLPNVLPILLDGLHRNLSALLTLPRNILEMGGLVNLSIWSTAYNYHCQKDLNEYSQCRLDEVIFGGSVASLRYHCDTPLLSLVILSVLSKKEFKVHWTKGARYEVQHLEGPAVRDYKMKLAERRNQIKNISIASIPYSGYFIPLAENVVPFAVSRSNKMVMSISKVGLGNVGFVASRKYMSREYDGSLKQFQENVANRINASHISADEDLMVQLDRVEESRDLLSKTLVTWNAHRTIGKEATQVLLSLVRRGLSVVIALTPWAYEESVGPVEDSELCDILIASGIWPSLQWIDESLTLATDEDVRLFPLVLRLDYAMGNLARVEEVAAAVMNDMSEIGWERLGDADVIGRIHTETVRLLRALDVVIKSMVPCVKSPLVAANTRERALIQLANAVLLHSVSDGLVAPGVGFYPGTVDMRTETLENVDMGLELPFSNEVVILGVYASPGRNVTVKASLTRSATCTLHFNHHLFDLMAVPSWFKWPRTSRRVTIVSGRSVILSSSFGGLLSLSCAENDEVVFLSLSGVVRVPRYDERSGDFSQWTDLRKRRVPWAVVAADAVVFVVPSVSVRNCVRPEGVVALWDLVIKEEYRLKGYSMSQNRREMVTGDVQIRRGYMHSGYPIGTTIFSVFNPREKSTFMFAEEQMKTYGRWGVLHEVGHSLQEDLFTFSGSEEVTNNVFALAATEKLTGVGVWLRGRGWVSEGNVARFLGYIQNGTFKDWQEQPFLALGIYAQMRHCFGWEFYRLVFRRYGVLARRVQEQHLQVADHDKIQLWINETSKAANMNLCPLFELWRFPIDRLTQNHLSRYPAFMVDDFLSKLVSWRVKEIIDAYGGEKVVSRTPRMIKLHTWSWRESPVIEGRNNIVRLEVV